MGSGKMKSAYEQYNTIFKGFAYFTNKKIQF